MFLERYLGLCMPDLPLLRWEVLPGEPDDFRQCAVIGLDVGGHMLVLDERGPEEDERVGRARDVVLWLLLSVTTAPSRRRCVLGGREEHARARRLLWRRRVVERHRGHRGRERDTLGRGRIDWRSPGQLYAFCSIEHQHAASHRSCSESRGGRPHLSSPHALNLACVQQACR